MEEASGNEAGAVLTFRRHFPGDWQRNKDSMWSKTWSGKSQKTILENQTTESISTSGKETGTVTVVPRWEAESI